MWQEPEISQDPEPEPEQLEINPAGPNRRTVAIVGILIAIMLAVFVATQTTRLPESLSGHAPPQRPTSQAGVGPVPSPSAPRLRFDAATGEFLADGLRGTLPAGWFARQYGYISIGTGVGGCLGNRCPRDGVGQHPMEDSIPWGAEFEVVTVEPALTGGTIDRTADQILRYWNRYASRAAYTSESVAVKHKSERTLTINLPRPARMITADLHYRNPDRNIKYDHFYLVVVGGSTGQDTAYVATWSDNAPADAVRTIQNSINTLQVV